MNDEPKITTPAEGGCYVRDPETGVLTRVPEEDAIEKPTPTPDTVEETGKGRKRTAASDTKE